MKYRYYQDGRLPFISENGSRAVPETTRVMNQLPRGVNPWIDPVFGQISGSVQKSNPTLSREDARTMSNMVYQNQTGRTSPTIYSNNLTKLGHPLSKTDSRYNYRDRGPLSAGQNVIFTVKQDGSKGTSWQDDAHWKFPQVTTKSLRGKFMKNVLNMEVPDEPGMVTPKPLRQYAPEGGQLGPMNMTQLLRRSYIPDGGQGMYSQMQDGYIKPVDQVIDNMLNAYNSGDNSGLNPNLHTLYYGRPRIPTSAADTYPYSETIPPSMLPYGDDMVGAIGGISLPNEMLSGLPQPQVNIPISTQDVFNMWGKVSDVGKYGPTDVIQGFNIHDIWKNLPGPVKKQSVSSRKIVSPTEPVAPYEDEYDAMYGDLAGLARKKESERQLSMSRRGSSTTAVGEAPVQEVKPSVEAPASAEKKPAYKHYGDIPKMVSLGAYSDAKFGDAFKKARKELGANQVFEWKGKKFITNYAGEKFDVKKQKLAPAPAPMTEAAKAALRESSIMSVDRISELMTKARTSGDPTVGLRPMTHQMVLPSGPAPVFKPMTRPEKNKSGKKY